MSDNKKQLIAEKAQIRSVRPRFMRQKGNLKKRISRSSYRAPKGLQSKMGDNKAGHRSQIKTGFGYPKAVRGLNRIGLTLIHVENVTVAQSVDPKTTSAIVSASLGQKKKIEVVRILVERKVAIQNIKDANKFLADAQATHASAKEIKQKEAAARQARKETALKAKQGKKTDEEKAAKAAATPEAAAAAKEAEKKENDKLLRERA